MHYCNCSQGEGNSYRCSNAFRGMELMLYWSQKNGSGVRFTVLRRAKLVHYCSPEKETGVLLFSGEGIWCSTVLRRRKLVHYCYQGEGNWCSTAHVFRRRELVLYCSREKGDWAVAYSGERKWCCTKFTG